MVKIRQAIVVEGKYDQNTLSQLVDTTIFQTRGFGVMHDKTLLELLRKAARTTGLIIFTDSDGAGFVIRNFLKGALPKEGVLHAYIPDIPGKEKRKRAPGKEGLLGVEGMTKEILLSALENAGADLGGEAAKKPGDTITKFDLYTAGLSGRPDSAAKRAAFLEKLRFPAHMSANALLDALNLLYTREEFLALFEETT
ncbi:MAG: toprim domain-containing protein [Oscillospiraceae bacterium]